MKAPAFDAVLDFALTLKGGSAELRAEAVFLGGAVPARFIDYAAAGRKRAPFVRVLLDRPADVKWADPFEVRTASGEILGRGKCLLPDSSAPADLKPARRRALLARLELGEKD